MTTLASTPSRAASSQRTLSWGLIGTGAIAQAFVRGVSQSKLCKIVAVGSRTKEQAEKFGTQHNIATRHGSYDALLADTSVEAVYISTPHPMHAEWVIKAARAKKHILVEKPMALNHPQAMAMVEAAREHGVFLMEAFMYRCHPQTAKIVELVKSGAIGRVTMIQATFGFQAGFNAESRIYKNELGGGGILDVGAYAISMSRLVAGAAQGKAYADPNDVVGLGRVGESKVDEYAAAVLKFNTSQGEIIAQCATAVAANLDNTVRIIGTDGSIFVPNPWTADRQNGGKFAFQVRSKGKTEEVAIETDRTAFSMEADLVAEAILAGKTQADAPAMSWGDSLGNLRTLDRWRSALKQEYVAETPAGPNVTASGEPLRRRANHNMKFGQVPHLDKKVSRFIFGCDNQNTFAHGAAVWDDFFERGGNAFDTAYIYGGGHQERLLGQWIKTRGVRNEVVVVAKGAHTPHCTPEGITAQLHQSLERLQVTGSDIYIMHRDNPDVPVGEFIDVLNEHMKAGRFKAFGGSNWSLERFKAAQDYAKKHGKQPMSILNNNLSLARMVKPVWGGCIASSDPDTRKFLEETGTAHFAWSSQARGYFLPEGERLKLGQDNFESWDAEDNRRRRERAYELAKAKGVSPINIAAAYVLNQPFPSFALIGPREVTETATTMPGLDITLTRQELKYLNLEADSPR